MGCDIHSRLEILRPAGWNGIGGAHWECVTTPLFENHWYMPDRPQVGWNAPMLVEPLSDRNYRLFAMLADVRNGRGFAGVDTGDWVQPIAEPKGVPFDASTGWLAEVERWDVDMHSHSFLTLAELEAYDWDGIVFERGFISEDEYLALRNTNDQPESWSGGISGASIITFTVAEYEAALAAKRLDEIKGGRDGDGTEPKRIYVQYQWATTRRVEMGELEQAMEVMRSYQPLANATSEGPVVELNASAIRIVFGFDN